MSQSTRPMLSSLQSLIGGLYPLHRISSCILVSCLGLSVIQPGYGEERIRWTPDPDRGSVGSTLSGGRRGEEPVSCDLDQTQLALMVPGDRSRPLTIQETPTLAWHVSTDAPVSMTFYLSDPTVATPIYSKTISIDRTAILSVTLPQDVSLELAKPYRWSVFMACPGSTQTEISARSFIERVDREFLNVNDLSSLEQAGTYAHEGIWYDAVAALLSANHQGVDDAEILVQTLLEQGQNEAEVNLSTVVNL